MTEERLQYIATCYTSYNSYPQDNECVEELIAHIRELQKENELLRMMVSDLKQESTAYQLGLQERTTVFMSPCLPEGTMKVEISE